MSIDLIKDKGSTPRRAQWLAPKFKRIRAGSAEEGGTLGTDLGESFS